MLKILKRKKKNVTKLLRLKNLTDFTRNEVLCIEDLLFIAYEWKNSAHDFLSYKHENNYNISKTEFINIINYLVLQRYLRDNENGYVLSPKGKVICEQGGIYLLWEKQSTQNSSKWISIISAFIAVCALIANILFSYFKES